MQKNQKDWKSFYKKGEAPTEPSSFAEFILKKGIKGKTLVDVGCGNGRDTYYLAKKYKAIGIDYNTLPRQKNRAKFIINSWEGELKEIRQHDIVYSRFFLHTLPIKKVEKLIKNSKKYFVAEARAEGDVPKLYPEHARHFVCGICLAKILSKNGFAIEYFDIDKGLAKYKKEDPLVIRIIAKRM